MVNMEDMVSLSLLTLFKVVIAEIHSLDIKVKIIQPCGRQRSLINIAPLELDLLGTSVKGSPLQSADVVGY